MTKLYVAIPCYSGQMHACCTLSLINLERECIKKGVDIEFEFLMNESLIPRARNILVNIFMNTSRTHLLFIDADIQFDALDIIKMIEADKDIIGGVYAKKEILWNKIASCVKDGKDEDVLKNNTSGFVFKPIDMEKFNNTTFQIDDPVEVKYVGTGMMLIKRHVFTKIKENFPSRSCRVKDASVYLYFDCKLVDNEYLSEDYYFCQNWRDLGGKVFIALWTKTSHYGTMPLHTDIANM